MATSWNTRAIPTTTWGGRSDVTFIMTEALDFLMTESNDYIVTQDSNNIDTNIWTARSAV